MKYAEETWSPERAAKELKRQEDAGHRNPRGQWRMNRVDAYARQMTKGQWRRNGSTIVFNGTRLMDGWHRLRAITKSGVTLTLLVVRDVEPGAESTIDTGKGRSAGDLLASLNVANSNRVAAAARPCILYASRQDVRPHPSDWPSNEDVRAYVDQHPGLVASCEWAKRVRKLGSPSTIAAWHYMCGLSRPEERDVFFYDLSSGVGLQEGQPALILREALLRNRNSRLRFPSYVMSAYIVKAWNAELEGRRLALLRFTQDEVFPTLR